MTRRLTAIGAATPARRAWRVGPLVPAIRPAAATAWSPGRAATPRRAVSGGRNATRRSARGCPSWIFAAQQRLTDETTQAHDPGRLRAALGDYLELAQQTAEDELELAAQQDDYALHGIPAGAYGAWDVRGGWHPQVINWAHVHWAHTIRGGALNSHTIAGGARLGASAASASASVLAARQQAADVPQQAQGGVQRDAAGLPLPGSDVRGHLDGGGVDSQVIPPKLPEGSPGRPARDKWGTAAARSGCDTEDGKWPS